MGKSTFYKPPSKEQIRIAKKALNQYANILASYVVSTTKLEEEIEKILATFFYFEKDKKEYLIQFLIIDNTFNKKVQMLRRLLNQKQFNKIDIKNFDKAIENISKLNQKRNRLAHAIPVMHHEYKKGRIKRIAYTNKAHSATQKMFISKKEEKEDLRMSFNMTLYLWGLRSNVEGILYEEQVRARMLQEAIAQKMSK